MVRALAIHRSSLMKPLIWLRQVTEQTLIDVHRRHMEAECRAVGKEIQLTRPVPGLSSVVALAERLAGELSSPSQAAMREERRLELEKAEKLNCLLTRGRLRSPRTPMP